MRQVGRVTPCCRTSELCGRRAAILAAGSAGILARRTLGRQGCRPNRQAGSLSYSNSKTGLTHRTSELPRQYSARLAAGRIVRRPLGRPDSAAQLYVGKQRAICLRLVRADSRAGPVLETMVDPPICCQGQRDERTKGLRDNGTTGPQGPWSVVCGP